jgi:hypothetical protein
MTDRYDETTDFGYDDTRDHTRDDYTRDGHDEEPRRAERPRIREGMPANVADSELILRRVIEMIATAGTVPLSSSPRINREEVLEMLEEAVSRLPEELKQARWLLKERNEFIARTRSEADEILDASRVQAERMVQRQEIVRAAEAKARHTLDDTEAECRKRMRETEDWCDRRLASFQIVLDKVSRTVVLGRERLNALNDQPEDDEPAPRGDNLGAIDDVGSEASTKAFFDQDDG